ncbi:hypothetical protein ACF1BE_34545 [Streptomyces sp. NPDC014991]|uniref:hypothetical protein n=1 Tax=Streptomyces sp. NPDC014991 TaxID=3364935 RepID=UPI0037035453
MLTTLTILAAAGSFPRLTGRGPGIGEAAPQRTGTWASGAGEPVPAGPRVVGRGESGAGRAPAAYTGCAGGRRL